MGEPLTRAEIEAMWVRVLAATPGRRFVLDGKTGASVMVEMPGVNLPLLREAEYGSMADCALAAHARDDITILIADLKRAYEALEEALSLMGTPEHAQDDEWYERQQKVRETLPPDWRKA